MRLLILGVICLLLAAPLRGQFFLNGEAIDQGGDCYQLTQDINWQSGSIWNAEKITLAESFDVVLEMYFGCKDADGADGIVFGFQPVSTSIGSEGGDIGFGGITPSLGIEFDTWQNNDRTDPFYDHISIFRNGDLFHQSGNNLAGPVQASAANSNIEDCQWHDIRVSWDASTQRLEVYFDCELRLAYVGDLVNGIFGGDPWVFWGFTSATGGSNNIHGVCFSYTTFTDQIPDVVLCPGGEIQLQAKGGVRYEWTPVDGLDDPTSATPIASPAQTTTYTVAVLDDCNRPLYDEVTVEVAGDSVFFELGADTLLCEGEQLVLDVSTPTATYQWSDGSNSARQVVTAPGFFAVTVTRTDTVCTADDRVNVEFLAEPEISLGPDTSLCTDQLLLLSPQVERADYIEWQDGSRRDTFLVTQAGRYLVSAFNICGVATAEQAVRYESCREIYLPNAFSPNNDGLNDRWLPLHGGDVQEVAFLRIFDRWGNQVWEATNFLPGDEEAGWDGWFRGRQAPMGAYVFTMELTFRDGRTDLLSGELYLLR